MQLGMSKIAEPEKQQRFEKLPDALDIEMWLPKRPLFRFRPPEQLLNLRLHIKTLPNYRCYCSHVDCFVKQLTSLFISWDLYSLCQFEYIGGWHFTVCDQRQQDHQPIHPDKSLQGQTFNNALIPPKFTSIVVLAPPVIGSSDSISINQPQTIQPSSSVFVFASQPFDPAVLNGADEFAASAACPTHGSIARHASLFVYRCSVHPCFIHGGCIHRKMLSQLLFQTLLLLENGRTARERPGHRGRTDCAAQKS